MDHFQLVSFSGQLGIRVTDIFEFEFDKAPKTRRKGL